MSSSYYSSAAKTGLELIPMHIPCCQMFLDWHLNTAPVQATFNGGILTFPIWQTRSTVVPAFDASTSITGNIWQLQVLTFQAEQSNCIHKVVRKISLNYRRNKIFSSRKNSMCYTNAITPTTLPFPITTSNSMSKLIGVYVCVCITIKMLNKFIAK